MLRQSLSDAHDGEAWQQEIPSENYKVTKVRSATSPFRGTRSPAEQFIAVVLAANFLVAFALQMGTPSEARSSITRLRGKLAPDVAWLKNKRAQMESIDNGTRCRSVHRPRAPRKESPSEGKAFRQ